MGGREGKHVDSGSPRVRQLVNITSAVTKQGGVDWGRKWGLTITNPPGPPSSDRLSQARLHLPKVLIYDLSKWFHSWRTWACGECFTIALFLLSFFCLPPSLLPSISSPVPHSSLLSCFFNAYLLSLLWFACLTPLSSRRAPSMKHCTVLLTAVSLQCWTVLLNEQTDMNKWARPWSDL